MKRNKLKRQVEKTLIEIENEKGNFLDILFVHLHGNIPQRKRLNKKQLI